MCTALWKAIRYRNVGLGREALQGSSEALDILRVKGFEGCGLPQPTHPIQPPQKTGIRIHKLEVAGLVERDAARKQGLGFGALFVLQVARPATIWPFASRRRKGVPHWGALRHSLAPRFFQPISHQTSRDTHRNFLKSP